MQNTIKSPVVFEGVGLHSGAAVRMVIRPAPVGHGIKFRRTDIALGNAVIPALWHLVERSPLCTRLVNVAGVSVATVEHVMAALAGCGVHNVRIDIDGPEAPILDGSALPFVKGILSCGVMRQGVPVRGVQILRPVTVEDGDARATLRPATRFQIAFDIDFADRAIGHQSFELDMANGAFARELSDCRTFCRRSDIDAMRAAGLIRGGTLDNAVVVDGDDVLTPGGLRRPDEAVRHKMLDALGDLALAGGPILGRYEGVRAGHALTNTLLRKVFATEGAARRVAFDAATAARLPGEGLVLDEVPAVA